MAAGSGRLRAAPLGARAPSHPAGGGGARQDPLSSQDLGGEALAVVYSNSGGSRLGLVTRTSDSD